MTGICTEFKVSRFQGSRLSALVSRLSALGSRLSAKRPGLIVANSSCFFRSIRGFVGRSYGTRASFIDVAPDVSSGLVTSVPAGLVFQRFMVQFGALSAFNPSCEFSRLSASGFCMSLPTAWAHTSVSRARAPAKHNQAMQGRPLPLERRRIGGCVVGIEGAFASDGQGSEARPMGT